MSSRWCFDRRWRSNVDYFDFFFLFFLFFLWCCKISDSSQCTKPSLSNQQGVPTRWNLTFTNCCGSVVGVVSFVVFPL